MSAAPVLGEVSAAQFLSDYWQQQPLLVRGALAADYAPVSGEVLAGLSLEEAVEARLVLCSAEQKSWQLRHGPFNETEFLNLPERNWTLLVQALDLWLPEVAELLTQFDFLPRWRLDDVMASYAVPGGSVGPHFDHYDVFLVQTLGDRLWRIGQHCDRETPLLDNTDLKILKDFAPTGEWLLEPGDMLYLPPGLAHWGIAQSACVTLSVGFRAPTLADLLGDLAVELTARGDERHYRDPPLTLEMAEETIAPEFIAEARKLLTELLDDDELLADWFARFMTAPKYPELEALTGERRLARIGERRYENGEISDDADR
jgi:50S ribosomal protein L16 3-hydroxylase